MGEQLWPQIVGVVGVLLGTSLGVIATWVTTQRQLSWQARLEAQKRFIEKMEALHDALSKLYGQAGQIQTVALGIIGFERTLSDFDAKDHVSTAEMHMLVEFYAPSLRPEAQRIEKGIQRLIEALAGAGLRPKLTDDEKTKFGIESIQGFKEVTAAIDIAKRKLHELVSPHAAVPK